MAAVKFKSQEEFDAFKKKMVDEAPPANATKGPEDQRVKTYNRPDQTNPEEISPAQLERQELNRKLRDAQMEKEEEAPKSFSERHPRIAKVGEAIKGAGRTVKEELKRVSKNAEKLEKKEQSSKEEPQEEEEIDEEELKPSKKSKKSKHKEIDEDFGEDSESMSTRSSGKKPFSENYKEVYSGKKVLSGDYKEVYKGRMGNDEYAPPKVPKTHGNFLHEERPQQQRAPQHPARQSPTLLPMPKVGSFGNGNIKMPTMSFGGIGAMPKVGVPSTGNHKIGKGGNIPSINIPTLGGSTLIVGSGLMGKTANNKMGTGSFNIPKIGNWDSKSPLKTELNLPNIGNLTIMGAGKQKGGIKFGLGDIPKFGLGTPEKKKKV